MLGMFRRAAAAPSGTGAGSMPSAVAVGSAAVAVAAPDAQNIYRIRALQHELGMGMQGYTGTVYGYDRGDPANSATGPIDYAQPQPTGAFAKQTFTTQMLLDQPQIYDSATNDPAQAAYRANLLARIAR